MNWNRWIRTAHRWISLIFTGIVIAIFGALALGLEPAEWVYMLPLAPLALLVFSGLYLFALPYLRGRHST